MTEAPFGRPQDKDIEKQFMKKIRGDKLQTINAECELQICLAFKYGKKQKTAKKVRGRNRDEQEYNQSMEDHLQMLEIGNNFDVKRRQKLVLMFKEIKEKWKFEEIEQNLPLPNYFFDDGCDLSYILYQLQKTEDPDFQQFSAADLLLLEFLCLEGRKHLNETIIKYYKQHMTFMIEAMKSGLSKIDEKLQAFKSKNNSKSKDRKIMIDQAQSQSHKQLELIDIKDKDDQKNESEKEEKAPLGAKKKRIKKDPKKVKKEEQSSSQKEEGENGNDDSKDKELALKTCNYISWAYWYIIKKQ